MLKTLFKRILNLPGCSADADVNDEGGDHDNEFYREISHIDLTIGTNNADATGIHWAVSQATSIQDVVINVRDCCRCCMQYTRCVNPPFE